jgi:hypothetical protein
MSNQPACPECERLFAVEDESNKIGEFLDWLDTQEISLGVWVQGDLQPARIPYEKLLAKYFSIDLGKVEKERRALLNCLRELNK